MLHMKGGRPPKNIQLVVVSPPCELPLVSLRSEEVILRKVRKVFVGGCNGNN